MIITQTPLRVSLAGGGSDFPDFYLSPYGPGFVVSTAIDKYVYVILKKRCDDLIIANYSCREEATRIDDIKHELIREALRMTNTEQGIEIHTLADIRSESSGLGSSSAFTVGILNALHAHKGQHVTSQQLAEEACDIELGCLGKSIGKQDQYIAAYGGLCSIRFSSKEEMGGINVTRLNISEPDRFWIQQHLMMFYLGKGRAGDDLLVRQRDLIPQSRGYIKELAGYGCRLALSIEKGEFTEIGSVLKTTWGLKKLLAKGISTPEIDHLYEVALSAGAIGGKVCGAGGGGHLILYCDPEYQILVHNTLVRMGLKRVYFNLASHGSRVIFNNNT